MLLFSRLVIHGWVKKDAPQAFVKVHHWISRSEALDDFRNAHGFISIGACHYFSILHVRISCQELP